MNSELAKNEPLSSYLEIDTILDPRLSRAFQDWEGFKSLHFDQIKNIGTLPSSEIVQLANSLSFSVMESLGGNAYYEPIGTSKRRIEQLVTSVEGEGNRIIFMRHGEQSPPEWVSSIPHPGLKKIRMMQNPLNKDDLLTNKAIVEAFSTALVFLHIQKKTGKKVTIVTSENKRALEVSSIISQITGSTYEIDKGLDSIIYQDERDMPAVNVESLLEELPNGIMPWDFDKVDKWCKPSLNGQKQSIAIVTAVNQLLQNGTDKSGNELIIAITHSQQLAEVLRSKGKLQDPSTRFPEMTMITISDSSGILIFRRGILVEDNSPHKNRNMRRIIENLGDGYEWYKIRRTEYDMGQKIPFLVSPEPLHLSKTEADEVLRIGKDVVNFMYAAGELYRSESDVKNLLDRGKPPILRNEKEMRYLFVRPDLIVTEQGFSICEIETSPFGLALAELLNKAYRSVGFNTLVDDGVLRQFLIDNTPSHGTIIYSEKTSSYAGQLQFLAQTLLSDKDRLWEAKHVDSAMGESYPNVYRGFYQHEYLDDLFVNNLVQTLIDHPETEVLPSFTPYMEEKALLSLIWDRRWESFLTKNLGVAELKHLREVVPPTWVVGQEQFFVPGLPNGIPTSEGLAGLAKSKRNFVLKKSGFGNGSSWAEGVSFLQEKSAERARSLLVSALQDEQSLYVVQEFKPSQERSIPYNKDNQTVVRMSARLRLTPYFSMSTDTEGQLVAIKATGCENTNYIHASSGSINTAVACR